MADDFKIAKLSDELEDAGWLGLSAASFLGLFIAANGTQGNLSTTNSDIVWTKTLDTGNTEQSFDFGIGKLKIEGGLFSARAGVHMEGSKPTHISMLFSFFQGGGGNSKIFLEMDKSTAVFADKDKKSGKLIGYKNANQVVKIELPVSAALEFNFILNEDNKIISSVQFYDSLNGIADAARGIIELDLKDKILVFPWLLEAGFAIDKLFLDLTETGATNFSALYPEVYDPSWKGIGAKEIDVLVPIDKDDKEFIVAGIEGFLYGFDGMFSGKAKLTYTSSNANHLLKSIAGEVEIRNNEVITSELSAIWNLHKASNRVRNTAASATANTNTASENNVVNTARTHTNTEGEKLVDFKGDLKTKIGFVHHENEERTIWGADIIMEAIEVNGQDSGLVFNGIVANALLWAAGGGFGVYSFIKGIDQDDTGAALGGLGLMFLAIADAGASIAGNPAFLPRLEQLALPKLGYRFIAIQKSTGTEYLHEILIDFKVKMKIDSSITKLFSAISSIGLTAANNPSGLFDKAAENLEIKGFLELEFQNLLLRFKKDTSGVAFMPDVAQDIRRIFKEKDLSIKAKKLPEIILKDTSSSSDSNFPKPIVSFQFVQKDTTPDKKYGLAIHLKGLGNSSFAVNTPAVGAVLYFWPKFDFEWSAQLAIEPKFTFVIPNVVYAEGVFDLNKPIPSFDGTQNKISVDVGVVYSGPIVSPENMEELFAIKNYNYQFGGEYVWGEATNKSGPADGTKYDFLFVEIHYEGKTPLFVIGPVGVYGLGGLFGRNIAPGNTSGDNSAMGIANWILGDGSGSFNNVKNWPSNPTGSTWHPSRDFENDKDKYAVGLFVKAGSAGDGGKTVSVDSILMLGFPEFWIALAGHAVIKPIGAKLAVVIVYDHASRTFAIKAVFEYRIKKDDGKIILVKAPFELGTGPDVFWIYLGHYLTSQGGPVEARILNLFNVKAYNVFDTRDLNEFGLNPGESFDRPDIPGPAYGQGAMWQLGPKTYGPSFINLKLFAALGYNIAVSFDPFLIFGELFAMGYIQLKIFFFKFKLGLAARLYGLASPTFYRFLGELKITIGLPWPFDDITASVDFAIQGGNASNMIAEPILETSSVALSRLESISQELNATDTRVPIDAIIALKFNKPIFEIINAPENGVDKTQLTINDENPTNSNLIEKTTSKFVGDEYNVELKHVLDFVQISHQKIGGGNKKIVSETVATWEPPVFYGADGADTSTEHHHAIYFNTLLNPELQFQKEELGNFYESRKTDSYISPCKRPTHVCILDRDIKPEIENIGDKKRAVFDTPLGNTIIRELEYRPLEYNNTSLQDIRLQWAGQMLVLAHRTRLNPPDSTEVKCDFLLVGGATNPKQVTGIFIIIFHIKLRGVIDKITVPVTLISDPQSACGFRIISVGNITANSDFISAEVFPETVICQDRGQVRFSIVFKAKKLTALIDYIEVEGPHSIAFLRNNQHETTVSHFAKASFSNFESTHSILNFARNINALNVFAYLVLTEMCFEQTHNQHGHWGQTCVAGCDNGSPVTNEEGIETIWDTMLMEPNREYSITYKVSSHGKASITGTHADKLDPLEKTYPKSSSSDSNSKFKTIKFRTENVPTQNIAKYVGYSFPMPEMQPLYTKSFLPLITLKNQGQIQKIFKKHYGADTLSTKVVDINGKEIAKRKTATLEVGSLPTDDALEKLAADCLPTAQRMTHLKVDVFERNLLPDTYYSLQLEDASEAKIKIPYTVSFTTSKYEKLKPHVLAYQKLWNNAAQLAVIDHHTASATLHAIINPIMSGNATGFDTAIEKVYQQLLGFNGGRLAPIYGSQGDLAAHLVSRDENGTLHTWAQVIEFSEPILGKEGVSISNIKPGTEIFQKQGIYITKIASQHRLILIDHSGSRMIIINSKDGITYNEIQTNSILDFRFSLENALKASIRAYIESTYIHLTDVEKNAKTINALQQTKNLSGLGIILKVQLQKMTIPVL